jgi:hypothetical protein
MDDDRLPSSGSVADPVIGTTTPSLNSDPLVGADTVKLGAWFG